MNNQRQIWAPNAYTALITPQIKEDLTNPRLHIINQIDNISVYWAGEFKENTNNMEWKRFNLTFWKTLLQTNRAFFNKDFKLIEERDYSPTIHIKVEWPFQAYWLQLYKIFEYEADLLTAINTLSKVSTKRWFRTINSNNPEIIKEEEDQISNLNSPFINILSILATENQIDSDFKDINNKATQDIKQLFDIAKEHQAFKLDRLGYQTYENKNKKERLTENEADLLTYNTDNIRNVIQDMLDIMTYDIKEKFNIEIDFKRSTTTQWQQNQDPQNIPQIETKSSPTTETNSEMSPQP